MAAAAVLLGAMLLTPAPSKVLRAQDAPPAKATSEATSTSNWNLMLGVGTIAGSPLRHLGSDKIVVSAFPYLEARWRERFFITPISGVGLNLIASQRVRAGIAAYVDGGRDEDGAGRLRGLDDVPVAAELRAFGSYRLARLSLEFIVRRRLDARRGLFVDVSTPYGTRLGRSVFVLLTPSLTWMDRNHAVTYFGVSPAQAERSTLPTYALGAGVRDIAVTATTVHRLSDTWGFLSYAKAATLVGAPARSPLTLRRTNGQLGAFVVYRFGRP